MYADIIWPGMILTVRMESIAIIAISLALEWPFYKIGFQVDWRRAAFATLIANAASFAVGFIWIPISTILWELVNSLLLRQPTFELYNYFVTPAVAALACTLCEYPVAKLYLKQRWNWRRFGWIYLGNLLSVGVAAVMAFGHRAVR